MAANETLNIVLVHGGFVDGSGYLVTTADKMIPPDAQRSMAKRAGATVVEERGSDAIYVSRPEAVARLIAAAAAGVTVASA